MKHRNNDPHTIEHQLGKVVKRLHGQRKVIEVMRSKGLVAESAQTLLAILSERADGLRQSLDELKRTRLPTFRERQQISGASVRALIQEDQRKQSDQTARLREARLERDASQE